MYHSIYFGKFSRTWKNTWNDWFLVPKERPSFAPPKRKTRFLEVPGASTGALDLSNYPQRYSLYENRQGSWTFIVVNPTYEQGENNNIPWYELVGQIQSYLQGSDPCVRAVLEDDPEWYYEGTFDVTGYSTGDNYSEITISYNVKPYKWYYLSADGVSYDPTGELPGRTLDERLNFHIQIPEHTKVHIYLSEDVEGYEEWEEMDLYERNASANKFMIIKDFIGDAPIYPTLNHTAYSGDKMVWHMDYKERGTKTYKRREVFDQMNTDEKSKSFLITNRADLVNSNFLFDNEDENYPGYMINMVFDFRKGVL